VIENPKKQGSHGPAVLGSELDADPFSGGQQTSRRVTPRWWSLKWLAALVALGFGLKALMPFLGAGQAPPPVSLLSPQTPALEIEAPPGGVNRLLSVAQIRWCLREDIRIEVFQRTAHRATPRFNGTVADYNRRCTRFRYRDNELAQARRDVDDARASIVEEAMADAYAAAASTPPGKLAAANYSVLTKDVQELLHALGYAPGAVDGFYGAKTKTAVEAFEANQGGRPTGAISEALRRELLGRVRSANAAEARLFEATSAERRAVRQSCAGEAGVAGYNRCVESAMQRLAAQRPARARPATESERAVMDQACARATLRDGDAGHDRCVEEQLADLAQLESKPNIAALTESEHSAIEDACDSIGAFYGPAAFYRCAQERLAEVSSADGRTQVAVAED
jgi:hypothetical protein